MIMHGFPTKCMASFPNKMYGLALFPNKIYYMASFANKIYDVHFLTLK